MNAHNNRTSSDDEHHRLHSAAPAAAAATDADADAVNTCSGHGFQRRLNATTEMSYDALTSTGHLRTGQYYRWNPDISHIPASRSSVPARTALYKSASADSAASSPWQQTADHSGTTSHNAVTLRVEQPVSCFDNVWTCVVAYSLLLFSHTITVHQT